MGTTSKRAFIALLLGAGALFGPAAAQPIDPERDALQPAPEVRSIEVMDEGTPVFVAPRDGAPRRGRTVRGTRLPIERRLGGEGCATGFWAQIGPEAYVCERHVRYSREAPGGVAQPQLAAGELLPLRYAFVRDDGTPLYVEPADYWSGAYEESLGRGFGLVITGRRVVDDVPFLRTRRGYWVEAAAMGFARGSDFAGIEIAEGQALDHAWVLKSAAVRRAPGGRVVRRAGRREVVHVAAVENGGNVRLTDGTYMQERDLAQAVLSEPPAEVAEGERWIDVNVAEQVLVAYEGRRPLFATLVSSGRERRTNETPLGSFRLWVKLAYSDMTNMSDEWVTNEYAMEQVPWVQYFEGANGFHAAFWHDDFGRRRSHGCVNLSPRDARFLFDFTRPVLPAGWDAIFPTTSDPGTVVRVR